MTLVEFEDLVRKHDIAYIFSDSDELQEDGRNKFNEIYQAARTLPIDDVIRIWNKYVDLRIADEEMRTAFYWNFNHF